MAESAIEIMNVESELRAGCAASGIRRTEFTAAMTTNPIRNQGTSGRTRAGVIGTGVRTAVHPPLP
jgi:hypothetical protein